LQETKKGTLALYTNKPYRVNDKSFCVKHEDKHGFDETGCNCTQIDSSFYPEVTWENSPVKLSTIIEQ
jgi:hypothetical protein